MSDGAIGAIRSFTFTDIFTDVLAIHDQFCGMRSLQQIEMSVKTGDEGPRVHTYTGQCDCSAKRLLEATAGKVRRLLDGEYQSEGRPIVTKQVILAALKILDEDLHPADHRLYIARQRSRGGLYATNATKTSSRWWVGGHRAKRWIRAMRCWGDGPMSETWPHP